MAGIDKIYLKDYNEYKSFRDFLISNDKEFVKQHNYSLLNGLYDLNEQYFDSQTEKPISNFDTAADVFIIQHLSELDESLFPNVVARLKSQYTRDFDLIKAHESVYDKYAMRRGHNKLSLIISSNDKCLRHIKREQWEHVDIAFLYNEKKRAKHEFDNRHLEFNLYYRCFYNWIEGCKYDRYCCEDEICNISVKKAIDYIVTSNLMKYDVVEIRCWNSSNNRDSLYKFIVL